MKKKRVGEIEFFRFIFCMVIFIFHVSLDHVSGYNLCPRGSVGVEFFFILSGLFMAQSAEKNQNLAFNCIGKQSAKYVIRKCISILPYHIVAFGGCYLLMVYRIKDSGIVYVLNRTIMIIPQFFLIHLSGVASDTLVNSVEWYISAMLIGMLFIYPFLLKVYDLYAYVIGPLLTLCIMGYMYVCKGHYLGRLDWAAFTTEGVLRAVADLNLGIISYELAKYIKCRNVNQLLGSLLTISCILGYVLALYYVFTDPGIKLQFVVTFLLVGSVAISYAQVNCYGFLFQNDFIYFLGKLSLPLYLNTNIIRNVFKGMGIHSLDYVIYLLIVIIVAMVLSMLEVMVLSKIRCIYKAK